MEFYINNERVPALTDSLDLEDEIESRSPCSFTVRDVQNQYEFLRGMPVRIENNGELLWQGYLETSDKIPVRIGGNNFFHAVECVDMHFLADKRRVAIAQRDVKAGDVVKQIAIQYLKDEGVQVFDENIDVTETTAADFGTGEIYNLEVIT